MSNPYSPLKVYLAAPFESRELMLALRDALQARGVYVTSTWLTPADGNNQNMAVIRDNYDDCRVRAIQDFRDIDEADVLVLYKPRELHRQPTTGGHHVEVGYALGHGKPVFVIGDRENIFHYHPMTTTVKDIEELSAALHLVQAAS
jgi:nucleoside 2-deoxyribosyltransferase